MEKRVGIVMPAINLWEKYSKPAIDSVCHAMGVTLSKDIDCSFLFIDNASTDETKTKGPKMIGGNKFQYIRNNEQWGFQRSINFGVNHFFSQGFDYVLVLNNDIRLHPQAIIRLVERFEKGGVVLATCLDVTGECGRNPEVLMTLDDKEKEICPETPHPCFSAFMVSHECWEEVGEFDELFFPAYYEDNDYHHRIELAGKLAITYPPAMFFHWGSATQNEALGRPLTNSANQHAQYIRKWGGNPREERFPTPFNSPHLTIKSTKQIEEALDRSV